MDDLSHRDRAIRALSAGRYDAAATRYTRAAHGGLAGADAGDSASHRDVYDPETALWVGYPLSALLLAAVSFRVADAPDRARNRAETGALVVADHRDHLLSEPVARAACAEWLGDFHAVVGDGEDARTAYDRAESGYADADPSDPVSWTTRPLLQAGTDVLLQLSRPDDLEWDGLHGSDPANALTRRARVKRSRFPSLVAARVEAEKLHTPRGSTEYGNGSYECPSCGSSDVNYVAETVLCLRCDTPVERV